MSKAKALYLVGLLIVALVFPDVSLRGTSQAQNNERQLLATLQLQPEPGNQVIVPNFKLEKYSDSSVTISSEVDRVIGSGTLLYGYQVDIANGTYKTFLLDPNEYPLKDTDDEKISNDEPTPGYVVSRWWARVTVQTVDPAFCKLTETTSYILWAVHSNWTLSYEQYHDGVWRANPSCVNTHWFLDSVEYGRPWYSHGQTTVSNSVLGDYYNWDFGNPGRKTWVLERVQINGHTNGTYTGSWSRTDGGEYSNLIYGKVRFSG
ncbi:MAG TPA: hypothetical protein VE262_19035 [Blastocatellia bacterium]|nr:hypothetical protein [Blastocatellia bacterium]